MNQERSPRRRGLLGLAAILLAATSLGAGALSLALFTDTAINDANAFTAGTIDISTAPASAFLTLDPLMPGDTVNAGLVVTNAGTANLRYAMTSSSTNADAKALRDQMTLVIKDAGTDCATFDGTTLYSGTLAGAAFGDVTSGAQAGDRALSAGLGETLCFRAALDIGTGNAFQGAATTTTFTFSAEQTKNNP
jgi:hypothetical protein